MRSFGAATLWYGAPRHTIPRFLCMWPMHNLEWARQAAVCCQFKQEQASVSSAPSQATAAELRDPFFNSIAPGHPLSLQRTTLE